MDLSPKNISRGIYQGKDKKEYSKVKQAAGGKILPGIKVCCRAYEQGFYQ